jgi:uncharacterized protein YcbK (DUF882 family)
MRNRVRIAEHFLLSEFECACCGRVMIDGAMAGRLEAARAEFGRPFVITSGYRCEKRNAEARGAERSRHMRGLAADVRASPAEQDAIAAIAARLGFTEIIKGGAKNYIHLGY